MTALGQEDFASRCADDRELGIAARHWTGGLRLAVGDDLLGFTVADGKVTAGVPESGDGVITISGPADRWAPLMQATPPPFAQISALVGMGDAGLQRSPTDPLLWWQYLPAVERAIELLRAPGGATRSAVVEGGPTPRHDSPVGRYVHVELDGVDHRIYYEEAGPADGSGIPMLLQHTAGSHSLQWRHLFEMPAITDHFRLLAYDLPWNGRS